MAKSGRKQSYNALIKEFLDSSRQVAQWEEARIMEMVLQA